MIKNIKTNIKIKTNFKANIITVPTAVAGLALGISGVTWSWQNIISSNLIVQETGAFIGALLIIALFFKFLLYPSVLLEDLRHPVVGSVLPTIAMTLMVVSKTISHHYLTLAVVLWLFAICLHATFLAYFTYFRIKNFNILHVVPSWLVPPIGIVIASITFPNVEFFRPLANTIFYFGLFCYMFVLPLVLYRLLFLERLADDIKPTMAILAAPASVLLAGYLTISSSPSVALSIMLAIIAILMTCFIYSRLFHLIRLPFTPSFASYTFPLAIGATALFKLSKFSELLTPDHKLHYLASILRIFAIVELLIATVIISYVAYKFALYFIKK